MSNNVIHSENKMGYMPMGKLILSMSLPMVISMIIQAFYNVADSFFVSSLSPEQFEFSAINLSFAAQNLLIAVAVGTGVGINALLSRALGEKDHPLAQKIAQNGIFLSICSYAVALILGLTLAVPYMKLMTGIPEVIEYGRQYLTICFTLSFGIFGEIVMERLMISTGKTILAMITQGVGAIANIILDPLFIFGFGWGIRGAAIATVSGQIIAFILAIFLNRKYNKDIHLSMRGYSPDSRIIGRIYAIGVPSIVMASIGSVMNMLLNNILDTKAAQDAFGTYFKLQSFVFMPVFGLNNGIVPIVAYNYGAQNKKRLMRAAFLGAAFAVGYMLLGLAVFNIFPEQLSLIFLERGTETFRLAVPAMRIISLSFGFAGACIIMGSVFQALGKSIYSMFTSITRQLVVLIPAAYLLSRLGDVSYVWWAFPIAEIASTLASVIFFIVIYKRTISKIPS